MDADTIDISPEQYYAAARGIAEDTGRSQFERNRALRASFMWERIIEARTIVHTRTAPGAVVARNAGR